MADAQGQGNTLFLRRVDASSVYQFDNPFGHREVDGKLYSVYGGLLRDELRNIYAADRGAVLLMREDYYQVEVSSIPSSATNDAVPYIIRLRRTF